MRRSHLSLPLTLLLLLPLASVFTLPAESAGIEVKPVNLAVGDMIHDGLGLRGYPGAPVLRHKQEDDESEVSFETPASLDAVFDYFHNQLEGQGWRRGDFELKSNEAEVVYRRGGNEIDFKLKRHGKSGRYTLEIEFEDDRDDEDDD